MGSASPTSFGEKKNSNCCYGAGGRRRAARVKSYCFPGYSTATLAVKAPRLGIQIDGGSLGPRRGAHGTTSGTVTVRSLKRVNVRTVPTRETRRHSLSSI